MENIFVEFLPPWIETGLQPAFYDKESGTALQQTARMYSRVNMLIRMFNKLSSNTKEIIEGFTAQMTEFEEYFDNLDVQEEINHKLDEMASNGELQQIIKPMIDAIKDQMELAQTTYENSVNTTLQGFRNDMVGMMSGTPIPVSSLDDMTDTDKVYVLTTDGYWYYYDGDSWERGGVYQATSLADFSVTPVKTTFSKRSANLIDIANVNILNAHTAADGMHESPLTRSIWLECDPNTTYTVSRSVNSGRFAIASFTSQPTTTSTDINQHVSGNSDYYITFTTPATSNYLVIYYWNSNYSVNTEEEALADLCLVEGISDGEVIPSYIVSITNENFGDGTITPEKTTFAKNSPNLFDKTNANLIEGYPNVSTGNIQGTANTRSFYIPCEGGKSYVVKKVLSSRFSVATFANVPQVNSTFLEMVNKNNATQIKITANQNANYLLVFFWNNNYDTATYSQIMDTIVVEEGSKDIEEYVPYGKIIEVKTENINDGAVTADKLSENLRGVMSLTGSLSSRNGIYGVQYDVTATSSACTRIGNAEGMTNDYIVEDTYQLNNGSNDFDNVFPWCDIRRCNVAVSGDGTKSITYEGETGFTLDGSNGNVMVEIPKFYTMRERVDNIERLCISGEPKSGFNVEPAFIVDGKEQDFIYIACYHKATPTNGVYSYTSSVPVTARNLAENISDLSASNLQSYDISTFLMLQKLMIIEFADRSIQKYLGGMTRLPYWTADTNNVIDGFGENYITFQENVGQQTMKAFWVGERIRVGDTAGGSTSMTNVRTITAITKNGTQYKVEYDGADMSDSLNIGDGVGCVPQMNGLCDSLDYHTGRRNFASDTDISNYVSPMRYRYIENVIGNVWEQIAGIRVKNLTVHYSFEPNINEAYSSGVYKTLGYSLPLQENYPSSNQGWILREGYDVNNRNFNLPVECGISGGEGKFAGGTFYSLNNTALEYDGVVGGAWDTYYWANVNTIRFWQTPGTRSILYGSRPIYRG